MENRRHQIGKIAAALLCGAAFAGTPAAANPSYTFQTIAITSTPMAGAFASVGLTSINDAGQVAFTGSTYCSGSVSCAGVFIVIPSGAVTKVIDGGPANVLPHQNFVDAIINHGGAVSFGVTNSTTTGPATSNWLDLWKNSQLLQIAPTRTINGTAIYSNPRLLDNARVVFGASDTHTLLTAQKGKKPPQPVAPGYCTQSLGTGSSLNGYVATLGGPSGGTCANTGILVSKIPTGTTQLRVANDGTYGSFNSVTVNSAATVAFSSHNPPGRTNVETLFVQKAGGATQQFAEIDNSCANGPPASGTCQFSGYANSLAINSKGQILTDVSISTWTSGNSNPSIVSGVALNGDAQNGQVAWPGMVIDGCTVTNAVTGPRAINKFGQIALLLSCASTPGVGAHQAIVVATPPVKAR